MEFEKPFQYVAFVVPCSIKVMHLIFIFSIAILFLYQKFESSEAKSGRSLFLVNGTVFDSVSMP
jgi:hypothetical protein